MGDFPRFDHTMAEVRKAGKALRDGVVWSDEAADDIKQVFRVANDWRDSHAFPMQRVRAQIIGQLNSHKLHGRLTAARLKRMPSIRKKLIRLHLDKVQDLAGVRAVVPRIRDVSAMVAACRSSLPHHVFDEDDYIAAPKASGYRSHHFKLEFRSSHDAEQQFNGRRVELQIRTRFQHSWATAVEAVGLFRGEDLKGGQGDPDWRRLFALMSSEIAHVEGRPELPDAPPRKLRIRELRDLNKQLGAAATLDSINQAVDFTDRYVTSSRSKFFLIQYDIDSKQVRVDGYDSSDGGTRSYDAAERHGAGFDTVLVEADKIGRLKQAFPNYFGDVQHFSRSLRRITKGKDAGEYVLPPQQTVAPPARDVVDPRWLRRSSRQRGRFR